MRAPFTRTPAVMPTHALPCYQVDAFTRTRFAGNPAAVCLLERWLPDPVLQAIAETHEPVADGGRRVRDVGDRGGGGS